MTQLPPKTKSVISFLKFLVTITCIASVSARVHRESWDESKKQGMTGEGEGEKETLARKPHDFEKLRTPKNAAFDWCGASIVD